MLSDQTLSITEPLGGPYDAAWYIEYMGLPGFRGSREDRSSALCEYLKQEVAGSCLEGHHMGSSLILHDWISYL